MAIAQKNIMSRLYLLLVLCLMIVLAIVYKLISFQLIQGEDYQLKAYHKTERTAILEPKRGNIYADDGSLLATSVAKYEIRWDATTVEEDLWTQNYEALSDSLGLMFNKPSSYYKKLLRNARANDNGYQLIARNLSYVQYRRIKKFPIFDKGANKGGFIDKFKVVREYPLGEIAKRTIGREIKDENGYYTRVGLDGAFGDDFLRGTTGHRWEQKTAGNHWKPSPSGNNLSPKDGVDIVSTINVNIQDIAHHALLEQLERFKADHGTVVVMETSSGHVKAISNLARTDSGKYFEQTNHAVGQSHEPGSTFKLLSLLVALEDGVIDTSTVVNTAKGVWKLYDRKVKDSKEGGYGKITVADAFKLSSNTAFAQIIHENYKKNPERFINRLMDIGVHKELGLPIRGEGSPVLRYPGEKGWSGVSLAWLSFGYEVSMTPLQILAYYNAIANNGVLVKPKFVTETRKGSRILQTFDTEVLRSKICSDQTLSKLQKLLFEVVNDKNGTGYGLKNPFVSIAGKTGTCQTNYLDKNSDQFGYISSFVGYFPAEQPKYSCIVVIHKPDKKDEYYGAKVSGPVFKTIAEKIQTTLYKVDEIELKSPEDDQINTDYAAYFEKNNLQDSKIPSLKGMSGMDAISVLENMGIEVRVIGNGKVTNQSVKAGTHRNEVKFIVLTLS